jgi:2-C-methyl-D-erythritol 4-phosphate cytidylyltransferase
MAATSSGASQESSSPDPEGRVAGIIVAGGSSSRMSSDKLWADLNGEPLVAHSIRALGATREIYQLVVVVRSGQEGRFQELLARLEVLADVVPGGAERQDSVKAGLEATVGASWVVIHDAARPLVTSELVGRGLEAARESGAAIAAVAAVDTVKVVEAGFIVATPDRSTLWNAQTPQVFRRDLLLEAHRSAETSATDDAALLEARGVRVRVYPGAYTNLKVTTDSDLLVARALLANGVR